MQRELGNAAVQRHLARQSADGAETAEASTRPLLRRGSQGPAVVDLQNRLNQLGAQPVLTADGLFGPRVQAALIAFQRANGLQPDGLCGPQTWAVLDDPQAKTIGPGDDTGTGDLIAGIVPEWGEPPGPGTGETPPKVGVGEGIAAIASLQVGLIDYSQLVPSLDDPGLKEPFGWRHLGQIYESGAGVNWPPAELKKSWRPGKVDWCAIFAVFCYQLAGIDATWVLGSGAKGAVKKVWPWDMGSRAAFEASIKPGDIAAVAAKQHHFVVVSVDPAAGLVESVDGNQEWGQIRKRKEHKLSDIVAYYTPN